MFARPRIDIIKLTMDVSSASDILEGIAAGVSKFSFSIKSGNKNNHKKKLTELSELLEKNIPIYSLDLYVENISPDEVGILASGLAHNNTLKKLNLRGNKIKSQGAKHLNEALKTNTGLVELELTGNPIQGHIDSCFRENKTLKRLSLFGCGINNRQAARLLDALKQNATLKELDLCENGLRSNSNSSMPSYEFEDGVIKCYPEGEVNIIPVIIDFLKSNCNLRKIRLLFNYISKSKIEKIAKAIKYNHTLTSAELSSVVPTPKKCLSYLNRNRLALEDRLTYEAPFTKGAIAGMFLCSSIRLSSEIGFLIGEFTNRQTGGRVAQVNRFAALSAQQEMEKFSTACLRRR